jgi:hypothetical protein
MEISDDEEWTDQVMMNGDQVMMNGEDGSMGRGLASSNKLSSLIYQIIRLWLLVVQYT